MGFEWDDKKNEQNKRLHGKFLSEAIELWQDKNSRVIKARIIGTEERFIISGFIDGDFWVSPFCYRSYGENKKIRIISMYHKDLKEATKYGW